MSPGIGTQMTPLEWRMVKAISSGVAFAAAKMMSPSFSRSSSSTTTTALPAAMSATACSTESRRTRSVRAHADTASVLRSASVVSTTVRLARTQTTKPMTTNTA